jgi:hypothetical protein
LEQTGLYRENVTIGKEGYCDQEKFTTAVRRFSELTTRGRRSVFWAAGWQQRGCSPENSVLFPVVTSQSWIAAKLVMRRAANARQQVRRYRPRRPRFIADLKEYIANLSKFDDRPYLLF